MPNCDKMTAPGLLRRQEGIAMLTVLMLTIILTIIGMASISTTTLDIRMAGGERLRESLVNTGESCLSSGVQIIQQILANGQLPATVYPGTNPTFPTLTRLGGTNDLESEIFGYPGYEGLMDTADPTIAGASPNARLTVGGVVVSMDIDRLYKRPKPGTGQGFGMAYEGIGAGAGGGGTEIVYRIMCYAAGPNQSISQVTGVYACVASGESCLRKI